MVLNHSLLNNKAGINSIGCNAGGQKSLYAASASYLPSMPSGLFYLEAFRLPALPTGHNPGNGYGLNDFQFFYYSHKKNIL